LAGQSFIRDDGRCIGGGVMKMSWLGLRVLVVGVGRQGLALARYLIHNGAQVTLNDQRSDEQLGAEKLALANASVKWLTGGHPLEALSGIDLICVSAGVPLNIPLLVEARRRNIPLTNDSQIFLEKAACPVIGITGSAGKTTTTTLVGRMMKADVKAPRQAWVGGNIGNPLVEHLDEIHPDDRVVLELSSFQLELVTKSPQVAAVLNITPNHLDRHGTMEAYTAAKARIIEFQQANDIAVLNREDPGSWGLLPLVRSRLVTFGMFRPERSVRGTFMMDEMLYWQDEDGAQPLFSKSEIMLRGEHNYLNVLAACAIALAAGISPAATLEGVRGFGGVAHRLEFVRAWNGIQFYNDSIATAPERVRAALNAFTEPVILLLGGRDKDLPWEDLAEHIYQRVDHVILFGEAASKIEKEVGKPQPGRMPHSVSRCERLDEAVQVAARIGKAGDVVLLSPGCTSFDAFKDFEERGEAFRLWVNKLP
jgi:UDP-N-acetylmuramoylalanine--D-glutamate ligase